MEGFSKLVREGTWGISFGPARRRAHVVADHPPYLDAVRRGRLGHRLRTGRVRRRGGDLQTVMGEAPCVFFAPFRGGAPLSSVIPRRTLMQSGVAGLAIVYGLAGCGDEEETGGGGGGEKASGTVTFGSNYSDPVPKK